MPTDQKEWKCDPSQQAGDREAYDRKRPDHMAIEVFENSKEQSPHAREVWADEPLK